MQESSVVEIADDSSKMRPKEEPEKWPIEGPAVILSNLKVDVPEFVPGQAYYPARTTGRTDCSQQYRVTILAD